MAEKLRLKFLKDEPILEQNESYFEFYHKSFVPALMDIISASNKVKTIGLFGPWGTGKSTIINQLAQNESFIVPIFDVWKYKDDALRRAFLIYLYNFFKTELKFTFTDELEKEFKGLYFATEISTHDDIVVNPTHGMSLLQKVKYYTIKLWFVPIFIIGVPVWIITRTFFSNNPFVNSIRELSGYLMFSAPIWWLFLKVSESVMTEFTKKLFFAFQPVIKKRMISEKQEAFNSPEQFESLFSKIIKQIPKDKKIAIVFDNLDRVDSDVAVQVLTTIKTFLEPIAASEVVFIIPCDYEAIRARFNNSGIDADESLRKLFSVALWTPQFIPNDLEEYTRKLIRQTGEDSSLINNESVIEIIVEVFSRNPRQIKQFINNLVSLIIVAHKTEVWDIIKSNTGYLAKVLAIRQVFPYGYERLKEHWHEPGQIFNMGEAIEEKKLRDFMLSTQRITVKNAKPFIYFKRPFHDKYLSNADEIQQALVYGKTEEAKEYITTSTDFNHLARYITGLYSEYSLLPNELRNIFESHLKILEEFQADITDASYFKKTIEQLERKLWKFYLDLPTSIIFKFIINIPNEIALEDRLRLIGRYTSSIYTEDLSKGPMDLIADIVSNLIALPDKLLDDDNKKTVREAIDKNFKNEPKILQIFSTQELLDTYISEQTVVHVLTSITRETGYLMFPIAAQYSYRVSTEKFGNIFAERLTPVITTLNDIPEYEDKALFIAEMSNCFFKYRNVFENTEINYLNSLAIELIRLSKSISNYDNKKDALLSLASLYDYVESTRQEQVRSELYNFLQSASPAGLESFFSIYKNKIDSTKLVEDSFNYFIEVFKTRQDCRNAIYEFVSSEHRHNLLSDLIRNTPTKGLDYLTVISEYPDINSLVVLLLNELDSLQAADSIGGYDWILANVNEDTDNTVKELFINHIDKRIKTSELNSRDLGFNLFIKAKFLGIPRRRQLSQQLLEWLREPGRTFDIEYHSILKLINFTANQLGLDDTPKRDFTYFLLKNIRPDMDGEILAVLINSLVELSPHYSAAESSFEDLLDLLKNWNNIDTKKLVLKGVLKLEPQKPKANEKVFWKKLNALASENDLEL